jgi:hypothetical protein
MARTRTLANLRTEVRERADVDSNYIDDAQLNRLLNAQLARLYRALVKVNKDHYFGETSLSVTAGTAEVAVPADFWQVLGVDVLYNGEYCQLYKYNRADRNRYQGAATVLGTRYRVRGSNIILAPTPTWSGTLRLQYTPAPPVLVDAPGTPTTWDGFAGYEEYAVIASVIFLKTKQEEDPSAEMRALDTLYGDIMSTSDNDSSEPDQVRDVESEVSSRWGYLYGGD